MKRLLALIVFAVPALAQTLPTLPQAAVDTTMPTVNGTTFNATACSGAGVGIQDRIDAAAAADGSLTHKVVITSSLSCNGTFTLPVKSGTNPTGTGWIRIETSGIASLPVEGMRIVPATHAGFMPKLLGPSINVRAINVNVQAHHYRLIGLEVGMAAGVAGSVALQLGPNTMVSTTGDFPHHLVVDRCYVHGQTTITLRRGIQIEANNVGIIDSYISDAHEVGADSQGIAGWNFEGPLKVVNNYIEGAAENLFIGGSPNVISTVTPSDITIQRNYFFKPLSWRPGDPSYVGIAWQIKNNFELKNGQRILIEGNYFNHYWASGGQTNMIAITATHEVGAVQQGRLQDITLRYNRFSNMAAWLGTRAFSPSDPGTGASSPPDVVCPGTTTTPTGVAPTGCLRARRWYIHDNLVEGVSGSIWGGNGYQIRVFGPLDDLVFEHNTFAGDGTGSTPRLIEVFGYGPGTVPAPNRFMQHFYYRSNVSQVLSLGIGSSGVSNGNDALSWGTSGTHCPGVCDTSQYVLTNNVIVDAPSATYPSGNTYPTGPMPANIRFSNYVSTGGGDYRLCTGVDAPVAGCPGASPYLTSGHDGVPVGVSNWATFATTTCGADSGDWSCAGGGLPAPTLSSIAPTSGAYTGGTSITNLAGTGFQAGATVTFGGVAATSVVVVSGTQITCNTPAHAAGAVNVVVTNPDLQSATLAAGYTYTGSGAPTISSLSAAQTGAARGSTFGLYTLTIAGSGFAAGATVTIGGVNCIGTTFVSSTTLTCGVPTSTVIGAVDVVVTNPDTQTVTSVGGFTYTKPVVGRP